MKPSEVLSLKTAEPTWIVRNVLPADYMVAIAGEAGAGKSVLMYHLAYAVASGLPFLMYPTAQSRVLYFDEENGKPDFVAYNQWAWAGHGQPAVADLDQWLRLEHFALATGWEGVMRTAIAEFDPGLVIIDTATSAFAVLDENDNAEAARIIGKLRAMRRAGMTFVILKHERERDDKSHRRAMRGAKVWKSSLDCVLHHAIAPRAKRRKDGLRLTVLYADRGGKTRASLAQLPSLLLNPYFVEGEPKGLNFLVKPYESPDD